MIAFPLAKGQINYDLYLQSGGTLSYEDWLQSQISHILFETLPSLPT